MANNYLLFSEMIYDLNEREEQWFEELFSIDIDAATDDDLAKLIELLNLNKVKGESLWKQVIRRTGYDWPGFRFQFEDNDLWIYTEEYGDLDNLSLIMEAFLEKFRPKDQFVLTWAETCSKPRPSEFGGGRMRVTANETKYWHTHLWEV